MKNDFNLEGLLLLFLILHFYHATYIGIFNIRSSLLNHLKIKNGNIEMISISTLFFLIQITKNLMQRLFFVFRKIFDNFQSVEIKFLFLLFQNDIYPCGSPSIAQKNFFVRSLPFKKVLSPFNVCLLIFLFYCNPLKFHRAYSPCLCIYLFFYPWHKLSFIFIFTHKARAFNDCGATFKIHTPPTFVVRFKHL